MTIFDATLNIQDIKLDGSDSLENYAITFHVKPTDYRLKYKIGLVFDIESWE
jgi:hypothetical protein